MSTPSEERQLLIAGYVLGDLSPEEAAEFQRLMAQDPSIAQEVAEMQTALEIAYAPPQVSPSPHLRSAILAKAQTAHFAASAEAHSASVPLAPPKTRKILSWRSGLEVAAAALIVALGIHNYQLQQALQISQAPLNPAQTRPTAPQDTALTYVLDATQSHSQASAKVVVNPKTLEATIVVQNLPPLPPGKVYALWTVVKPNAPFTTDDKQAILTEVFQVDDRGHFAQTIVVPKAYQMQELVTKVAVTIEDDKAPQKHTGSPIMITGL